MGAGGRVVYTYRCRGGRGVAIGVAIGAAAIAVRVQGRRDGVGAQLGVAVGGKIYIKYMYKSDQ